MLVKLLFFLFSFTSRPPTPYFIFATLRDYFEISRPESLDLHSITTSKLQRVPVNSEAATLFRLELDFADKKSMTQTTNQATSRLYCHDTHLPYNTLYNLSGLFNAHDTQHR